MAQAQDVGTAGGRPSRAPWRVGRLLSVATTVTVVALVLTGLVSFLQLRAMTADERAVARSQAVVLQVDSLQLAVTDAETGQRGYLITGRLGYLEPYTSAVLRIDDDFTRLHRLTAGAPRQRALLDRARPLVQDKLDELAATVALRRDSGFDAAQAVVLSNRGADDMTHIRQVLDVLEDQQIAELQRRTAESASSAARTQTVLVGGALLGALVVGLVTARAGRRITRALGAVTASAQRVSSGDLSHPAPVDGPQEVAAMAAAVNAAVDAIAAARDEALAATRAKSAFLATMSHEIRTPMNAVIGMTDLLLDTEMTPYQQELARTTYDSGEVLLSVINDILDFSKIEAGDLDLEEHPFSLRECVEGALSFVALAASAKELELVAHLDDTCPEVVVGDPTRFRQVVANLLSNAVKFTGSGEVVVRVSALAPPAGTAGAVTVTVSVTDTGIGIPADRMDRLFHAFSQVDSSTTRTYGGTGLGLVISQRLVEAMGGQIGVTSTDGGGSTFTFTAVLATTADRRLPVTALPAGSLAGHTVLVVDDNATNRRVLQLLLTGWGMTCLEAATPSAALVLLGSDARIDVAVLDMHMPELDGVQLAVALRRLPARAELPLVLLSSLQVRPGSEHRGLFSAILTKPARAGILRGELLTALAPVDSALAAVETSGGRRAGDAPALPELVAPEAPDAAAGLRVLLAEDNPINQRVAQLLLAKLGYQVDTVADGEEAVAAVTRTAYDVVLMDVQMPRVDGLEATRRIRAELPADRQPRIVAVTASVLVEDRAACTAVGMDDHLSKPIRTEELRALLTACATARAAQDTGGTPAGPDAAVRERLADLSGGDPEQDRDLFAHLLGSFLTRAPEMFSALADSVAAGDASAVERAAHSLRGAAANLGGQGLAQVLADVEVGANGSTGAAGLARVRTELDAFCAALEALVAGWDTAAPEQGPVLQAP